MPNITKFIASFTSFVLVLTNASSLYGQTQILVPQPTQISVNTEHALILPSVILVSEVEDEAWKQHLQIFGQHLERMTAGQRKLKFSSGPPLLVVDKTSELSNEASILVISSDRIEISVSSLKGLAHATATLLQLLGGSPNGIVPAMTIEDEPKLSYRSFMVDMGRNPHSLELLKETIDLLWYYKVDSLHLHLTDDQRIAFPSKAFPNIWDGNITTDQFKELEAYAVVRGITLIPELEVPGHSRVLRNRYPDVFGKSSIDVAKNEKAIQGIQTLLDEITAIFSSTPYVHIGGDEAFGVPEGLQRDLINRLHAHLKSKGKQTLVWEGPGPGEGKNKVNEEVIHLNWRTINYPAGEMLEDGYHVVNAAWDPLYIVDHYPKTNFTMTSPQHIYETMSITRFKHMNPAIKTFTEPVVVQPSDRLIGFCMPWWEGREENYFEQTVPRLIPFAEVAWNPSIKRDFEEFSHRVNKTESLRRAAFYPVSIAASELAVPQDGVFHNTTNVTISQRNHDKISDAEIRFTVDGSQPNGSSTKYLEPIPVSQNTHVRAVLFTAGKQVGHESRRNFVATTPVENLALGRPVTSSVSSGSPFSVERVTDGGTDNLAFYLGYPAEPEPILVTIDLESVQSVSKIVVHSFTIGGSFEKYAVEVSTDGKTYQQVGTRLDKPAKPVGKMEHKFAPRKLRYVRIRSHGNKGYVFDSFSKLVEVEVHE